MDTGSMAVIDWSTMGMIALILSGAALVIFAFFRQNRKDLRRVKELLKHEGGDVEFSTLMDTHRKNVAKSA